jgi:plasmid stabilization system protein ParE
MAEVSLHGAAVDDYEAALAWYQARSVRAAARFEAAVDRAIGFVSTFPEASPLCDDRHRYCALRRYPYGLVYRVDGDKVRVIAIPHRGQLPDVWAGRA